MTTTAKPTSERRERLAGIGLVNLATLTWATNMVLGRWLREDIGPVTLAASRFLVASTFYAVLLWRRPSGERQSEPDRWLLLVMGFCGVTLFAPTLYLGLRFTTAVNATLINGLGPLVTGILAALIIHEPMSRNQVSGAIVGLAGVIILISDGSPTFWRSMRSNVGDLIMVVTVALWALYSVLARKAMRRRSALSATAFSAFFGLPLLLLAAPVEQQILALKASPQLMLAILYIAIAPTIVGFLAWNEGVRRLGSSGAMVFYNTMPLYGALLGYLVLHEPVGISHLAGGSLIVAAGLWAARK